MIQQIKNFLRRRRDKRIYKAHALLKASGYRIGAQGESITLDEAIEVMVHQVTAGKPPEPEIYRLIYESLAISIHLASVGTSVYESLAVKDNIIKALEGRIRDMQCNLRSLQLAKEAADALIQTCRSLHSLPPILNSALAKYDKRS